MPTRVVEHAIVESPLQFLSALEQAARTDGAGTGQGARTIIFARESGAMAAFLDNFQEAWLPARTTVVRSKARRDCFDGAHLVYLGDPCSGAVQRALTTVPPGRLPKLAVLDDGLSTIPVLHRLAATRKPLQRPRQQLSASRLALSAAATARIRRHLRAGMAWATVMPVPEPVSQSWTGAGGTFRRHSFEHLRGLPLPRHTGSRTIVLGSALAVDGLIDPRHYRTWVDSVRATGPIEYHPHRREKAAFLAELAASDGVTIAEAVLPVELRLVDMPAGTTVHALPSSALVSLPLLSPAAQYVGTSIQKAWWTGRAGDRVRRELNATVA